MLSVLCMFYVSRGNLCGLLCKGREHKWLCLIPCYRIWTKTQNVIYIFYVCHLGNGASVGNTHFSHTLRLSCLSHCHGLTWITTGSIRGIRTRWLQNKTTFVPIGFWLKSNQIDTDASYILEQSWMWYGMYGVPWAVPELCLTTCEAV